MVELASDKNLSSGPPFPAVVGQERLKEALLAVGANDALDGVLVRGEKGTAKSTAARGLAELLPDQRAVADCPYGCPPDDPELQCAKCRERDDPPVETRPVPFVTLPLGASRERVVGSLSVADALDGDAEFNPGLLARVHRGILYVDEVNLLDDHLVDVLLDAAASGVNRVERDGVSVTHPGEFTLVGTMNPEEGDLRPQFRDRFDLQVEVAGCRDLDDRVEIVDRALEGFDGDYADETAAVRDRLLAARDLLPDVELPDSLAVEIAELCRDAGVDGHRADIATARAARTLAALDGRPTVVESDVRRGAEFALPHRLKSRPFEEERNADELIDEHFDDGADGDGSEGGENSTEHDEAGESGADDSTAERREAADGSADDADDGAGDGGRESDPSPRDDSGPDGTDGPESGEETDDEGDERSDRPRPTASAGGDGTGDDRGGTNDPADGDADDDPGGDRTDEEATPIVPGATPSESVAPGAGTAPDVDAPEADRAGDGDRAAAAPSADGRGARVRTERADPADSVDAAASVRAAATRGSADVESRDLRRSVRAGGESALVVFAVDASASMRGPMRAAKGVALDLLRDAYERRDEVAVVTFAGEDADVVLPPTDSVDLAARHLKSLPTGDRTPLPAGLRTADEVLARADPAAAVVVVVTDGRANAGGDSPTAATRDAGRRLADRDANVLVVDAGDGDRASLVADLVEAADAERVPLESLTPGRVADAVGAATGGEGR